MTFLLSIFQSVFILFPFCFLSLPIIFLFGLVHTLCVVHQAFSIVSFRSHKASPAIFFPLGYRLLRLIIQAIIGKTLRKTPKRSLSGFRVVDDSSQYIVIGIHRQHIQHIRILRLGRKISANSCRLECLHRNTGIHQRILARLRDECLHLIFRRFFILSSTDSILTL